jgi:uncharacterized protein YecT (DUF1311 family)
MIRFLIALVVSIAPAIGSRAEDSVDRGAAIRGIDFNKVILAQEGYSTCLELERECRTKRDIDPSSCSPAVSLSVEYSDITGDGAEEAIVNGRSCYGGTGGDDIHAVFGLRGDHEVEELSVLNSEEANRSFSVLFGNSNYYFSSRDGELVAVWHDTSGREDPLLIKYKWASGQVVVGSKTAPWLYSWEGREIGQFVVDSIKAAPMHRTSFNCAKATEEHERAICYVKVLADLDLKLGQVFEKRLAIATRSSKQVLINEQKQWISARNRECVIYKWWVDCMKEKYEERISELEVQE